jgi:hypothetical protein
MSTRSRFFEEEDTPGKRPRIDRWSWDLTPRDTFYSVQSVRVEFHEQAPWITFNGGLEAFDCVLVSWLQRNEREARIRRLYTVEQAAYELRESFFTGTGGWGLQLWTCQPIRREVLQGRWYMHEITAENHATEFWFTRPPAMEDGIMINEILCIMAREPGSDRTPPDWFHTPQNHMVEVIQNFNTRLMQSYRLRAQPCDSDEEREFYRRKP